MARRRSRRPVAPRSPAITAPHGVDTRALVAARRDGRWVWLALGLVVAAGAGLAWRHFAALAERRETQTAANTAAAADPTGSPGPAGALGNCRQLPMWLSGRGGSPQASLSTSERRTMGLVLVDPGRPAYQHPSWDDAGWLGPILLDPAGNVLVGPVPVINVLDNPPAGQNTVWQVDAVSEMLKPLIELPPAAAPGPENPFGLMGLALDCETGHVYASSVMGSDRQTERGRIFQLDTRAPKVVSHLDGIDAMGLVLYRGASGKRLYYGHARTPTVWSLPVAADGRLHPVPRLEFSIAGAGPRGDDRARRLRIEADGSMLLNGIEFSFNLVAPTEKPETPYRLRYDHGADRWRLRQIGQYEVTGLEGWQSQPLGAGSSAPPGG